MHNQINFRIFTLVRSNFPKLRINIFPTTLTALTSNFSTNTSTSTGPKQTLPYSIPTLPHRGDPEKLLWLLRTANFPENQIISNSQLLINYGKDESLFSSLCNFKPDLAVQVQSCDQVVQCVKFARESLCPIVCFGAGTSLEGHICALSGGLTIDTTKMDKVIEINQEDMTCYVESGIRRNELNRQLKEFGLFFPVDPGADATIGGMVSTRASGTNAVKYGTMKQNVMGLEVVLADGTVIETGTKAKKSSSGYDLTSLFTGSEGTLGILTKIRLRLFPLPTAVHTLVCTFASTSGAVNSVVTALQNSLDLARAELLDYNTIKAVNKYFNQSTAAEKINTRIPCLPTMENLETLQEDQPLQPPPENLQSHEAEQPVDAVDAIASENLEIKPQPELGKIISQPPMEAKLQSEGLAAKEEIVSQNTVRKSTLKADKNPAALFLEFAGNPDSVKESVTLMQQILTSNGAFDLKNAADEAERTKLWTARHSAYYAVQQLKPGAKAWPTDVCVPISKLSECIKDTQVDLKESDILGPIFGHIGDGNFHVILLYDQNEEVKPEKPGTENKVDKNLDKLIKFNERLVKRALALGGSCSGEHGIGFGKAKWMLTEHGVNALGTMKQIKQALDPMNIMNPGKIFPIDG